MKAEVMGFSRSIAIEYGRYGLRSNAVAPGLVIPKPEDMGGASFWNEGIGYTKREIGELETPIPMRERPTAENAAALFLAPRPAWMVSGQVLSVPGGFIMTR